MLAFDSSNHVQSFPCDGYKQPQKPWTLSALTDFFCPGSAAYPSQVLRRVSPGLFILGGPLAYKIKNWERFQHYKNMGGHPAWIKLYLNLLNDLEWHRLSGDSAKGLIMFWMIGSATGGVLPDFDSLCFSMRMPETKVKHLLSTLSHWIYDDSRDPLEKLYSNPTEEEKRREEEKKRKEDVRTADLLFQTFWKAYPKRIAKSAAKKAWDKLRPTDELLRIMIQAVEKWKKSDQWRKDNGQFIPHPATWINNRRWEDDPPPGSFAGQSSDPLDKLFKYSRKSNPEVREPREANSLGEVSSLLAGVDETKTV